MLKSGLDLSGSLFPCKTPSAYSNMYINSTYIFPGQHGVMVDDHETVHETVEVEV
jgi:hypothetical protein